jgi:8-oxo-dGTP pyrophosphatase MutT (NUDIX family)
MRHRVPVDVLVILTRNSRILLSERSGDVYMTGSWCLPGGHVEAGEDVVSAAIREVKEETGAVLARAHLRCVGVTHHQPPHGDARVGFGFVADTWAGEPTNAEPDRCARLEWFDPRQLPKPTMPYSQEIVRLFLTDAWFSLHGW